jgi:hypothetical protein
MARVILIILIHTVLILLCLLILNTRYESAIASASTASAVPARLLIMVLHLSLQIICLLATYDMSQAMRLQHWWDEARPKIDRALVTFERVSCDATNHRYSCCDAPCAVLRLSRTPQRDVGSIHCPQLGCAADGCFVSAL